MIGRSTRPIIMVVAEITNVTGIISSNLQIKKRRGLSVALSMHKSGAIFIVPRGMASKNARFF
jgi:hypothetical protein